MTMLQYYGPPPYTAPRGQYRDYYIKSQFGGGVLPAYGGVPRQKGHGLSSFLSGLFRSAVPLLTSVGKSVAKSAGKTLLTTGRNVLGDVLSGQNVRSSIVNRSKAAGQQMLKRAATATQGYLTDVDTPPPVKRRATTVRKGRVSQTKRKKKKNQAGQGRKKTNKKRPKKKTKKTLF